MQKALSLVLAFTLLLGLSSCQKEYFLSKGFKQQTKQHQKVAVAPIEMIFTGSGLSTRVSEEDKAKLEVGESLAFQTSMYNQLQFSKMDVKPIHVDFLTIDKTNKKLKEKGISIRDSWEMSGDQLAAILGVDAVIKTRVYKTQYLPDLASFGIDMGKKLLAILSGGASLLGTSGKIEKTNDIRATCSLVNKKDGEMLWSMQLTDNTDWDDPTPEIVDKINRKFAKNFPYRKRR